MAATPRQQRQQINRDWERAHKQGQRTTMRDLRGDVAEAKRAKREAVLTVKAMCELALARYRRSADARRKALEAELAVERETADAQCESASNRARARGDVRIAEATRSLGSERYDRKVHKIWQEPVRSKPGLRGQGRQRAAEQQAESDDEVENNLPEELVAIWRKTKRRFKATARRSRTETFLEWAAEHPAEVQELQAQLIEEDVEALAREESTRGPEHAESELEPEPLDVDSTLVARFRNTSDGVESRVHETERGYAVTLYDLDARQQVGSATVYPSRLLEKALDRARELVGEPDEPGADDVPF